MGDDAVRTADDSGIRDQVDRDLDEADAAGRPIRDALHRLRMRIHDKPWLKLAYQILIAAIGGAVVVIGLILVPLPGPGWLIVFIGLAILGTEFAWARRLREYARAQLKRFWAWWRARRERRAEARGAKTRAPAAGTSRGRSPAAD